MSDEAVVMMWRRLRTNPAFARFIRARQLVLVPSTIVMLAGIWLSELDRWRVWTAFLVILAVFSLAVFKPRQRMDLTPRQVLISAGGGMFMQSIFLVLTGGITSPFTPQLFAALMGAAFLLGMRRETAWLMAIGCGLVTAIALLPRSVVGPGINEPYYSVLVWSTMVALLLLLTLTVSLLSDAGKSSNEALNRMREELLVQTIERTRSLEAVSSKVAHELKNPLSAMKALVQLLLRSDSTPRTQERLDVIHGEIVRMENIMSEYMSFSRPLQELSLEEVELGGLADEVLSILEARAEEAKVKLEREGPAISVRADPRRLKEALLNFVSNAVEATPPQGRVRVELREHHAGAELIIADNGRGLTPEALAKIGTPFFTTREKGTGLGVVIAKAVIGQHGGAVDYASELGRGTTVTVRIPRTPPAPTGDLVAS